MPKRDGPKARGKVAAADVDWVVSKESRVRLTGIEGLKYLIVTFSPGKLDDEEIIVQHLADIFRRKAPKPTHMELARLYRTVMDEKGWTSSQLAVKLGISNPTVSRTLALLSLPEAIQAMVDSGKLRATTAYEISKLRDYPKGQVEMAERAAKGELTCEQAMVEVKAHEHCTTHTKYIIRYKHNRFFIHFECEADSRGDAIEMLLEIATAVHASHCEDLASGVGESEPAV
jgi:hypothetical protein